MAAQKMDINVILMGDKKVGKTSLRDKFLTTMCSNKYLATIGEDFSLGDTPVKFKIWDSIGQESLSSADGCVFVYDVTSAESFHSLEAWRRDFLFQAGPTQKENFPFLLVGNKVDLQNGAESEVSQEEAKDWAKTNGNIPFFETSAKTGMNLRDAFETLAKSALGRKNGMNHNSGRVLRSRSGGEGERAPPTSTPPAWERNEGGRLNRSTQTSLGHSQYAQPQGPASRPPPSPEVEDDNERFTSEAYKSFGPRMTDGKVSCLKCGTRVRFRSLKIKPGKTKGDAYTNQLWEHIKKCL